LPDNLRDPSVTRQLPQTFENTFVRSVLKHPTHILLTYPLMCDVVFTVLLRAFCCLNIVRIVKKIFIMGDYRS